MQFQQTIDVIAAQQQQGMHPGAQVAISQNGQILLDWCTGQANWMTGHPMTTDTPMLWMSAGKPIVAAGILKLWDNQKLSIHDPVARFIPSYAAHGKEKVTVWQLLTHTAPIRIVDFGWPGLAWDQQIEKIAQSRPEPRWIPGQTAGYSPHVGWMTLGEILQQITGQPFDDYLRDEILQPLGMNSTFFRAESADQNHSRMANTQSGQPVDADLDSDVALQKPRPGGSARGPAHDLLRFYHMLLNGGITESGQRLLGEQTVLAMTSRQRFFTQDKTFNAVMDWGLGVICNSTLYGSEKRPYQFGMHAGKHTVGHSGNQSSIGWVDYDSNVCGVVIFNGQPGEAAHQQRMDAVMHAIYSDLQIKAIS